MQEGRRELVLTGKAVQERVAKSGLDNKIFSLKPLNFLEVYSCTMGTSRNRGVRVVSGLVDEKFYSF